MAFGECLIYPFLYFVPYPSEDLDYFFFFSNCISRVFEAFVNPLLSPRKVGADLTCMVAHGHHAVELNILELAYVFRPLMGYVDAYLLHNGDGKRAEALWL